MSFLIVIAALAFLMLVAYRGSVILFAPVAALGAVLLIDPSAVAPIFSGIYMESWSASSSCTFPCSCWAPSSARSSSCRAFGIDRGGRDRTSAARAPTR